MLIKELLKLRESFWATTTEYDDTADLDNGTTWLNVSGVPFGTDPNDRYSDKGSPLEQIENILTLNKGLVDSKSITKIDSVVSVFKKQNGKLPEGAVTLIKWIKSIKGKTIDFGEDGRIFSY